jgi:DNA-binding NarL/FixJ family response regulator
MQQPVIHIGYAEPCTVVRQGITALLKNMDGITVDIETDDGADLIKQIEHAPEIPDICILEIDLKGINGFNTAASLKKRWPNMGILTLTLFEQEMYMVRMITSGTGGYLKKTCDAGELRKAIQTIYNNGTYYSENFTREFVQAVHQKKIKLPRLTPMEMVVLKKCSSDLSYGDIAVEINTTTRSVEGHRDNLFKKLNVHSRTGLVLFTVDCKLMLDEMSIARNRISLV